SATTHRTVLSPSRDNVTSQVRGQKISSRVRRGASPANVLLTSLKGKREKLRDRNNQKLPGTRQATPTSLVRVSPVRVRLVRVRLIRCHAGNAHQVKNSSRPGTSDPPSRLVSSPVRETGT